MKGVVAPEVLADRDDAPVADREHLAYLAADPFAADLLEVGPAYAAWTGIGAAGTVIVGMVLLGELMSTLKLVSIALVLAGVIGLQLSGGAH